MFEVAFSRRMCCSRVCSARRKRVCHRDHGDPDQPSRQRAFQSSAYGHEAGVRSAVEQGNSEPLAEPDSDVGPHSPGGVVNVKAIRSQAAITMAPRACVRSAMVRNSSVLASRPLARGLHDHGEQSISSIASVNGVLATTTSIPSASRPGGQDPDGLRQGVAIEQNRLTGFDATTSQCHGLGGCWASFEQAGSCRG